MLCNELLGRRERREVDLGFNNYFVVRVFVLVGQDFGRIDGRKLRSRSQIVFVCGANKERKPSSQAGLGTVYTDRDVRGWVLHCRCGVDETAQKIKKSQLKPPTIDKTTPAVENANLQETKEGTAGGRKD